MTCSTEISAMKRQDLFNRFLRIHLKFHFHFAQTEAWVAIGPLNLTELTNKSLLVPTPEAALCAALALPPTTSPPPLIPTGTEIPLNT